MTLLEEVLGYAERDCPIIPLHSRAVNGGCTCEKSNCGSPAKHPRTPHGLKDATTDTTIIREWWTRWPSANVGMATGLMSGLLVIDLDSEEATRRFLSTYPEAEVTLQAETGRGRHFYFQWEEGIRNHAGRILGERIDVRGEGGFVILPPSVHSNGKIYEWLNDSDPLPLPPPLKQTLTGYSKHELGSKSGEAPADRICEGQRNTVLTSLAGSMRHRGMTEEAIEAALHAENRLRCDPPLSDAEVTKIAQSVARYQPDSIPFLPKPQTGKETNFRPRSALEILESEPQPVEWVWDRDIAKGDLFLLAAFMKVGKSTLAYPLVIAVARGEAFLDRSTKKGAVLILALEEHPRDVELRLRKLGMKTEDPIYIHSGPLHNAQPELTAISSFIQANGITLVLIDSLPYWWDVKNENDNAQVVKSLQPVLQLARTTEAAIGLLHHESKYGGRNEIGENQGDGKSIRGGSALFGIVDQALLLDRRRGGTREQRVLKAIGRRSESPRKLEIKLLGNPALSDPSSYSYRVLGTVDELSRASNSNSVAEVLTNQPKDIQTIAKEANLSLKAARESAETLVTERKAVREGKGVKGDSHTYRRGSSAPHGQNSILSKAGSIGRKETNPGNGETEAQRPTPVEWPETDLWPTVWI